MPLKVLVVCLGNICRSPIGEAVLRQVASERGVDIEVDSAGTGAYHVGEEPDERCVYVNFVMLEYTLTRTYVLQRRSIATCQKV